MRLDHIEKLCEILYCEPNDLLVYTPGNLAPLPPGHPLNKLISNGEELAMAGKNKNIAFITTQRTRQANYRYRRKINNTPNIPSLTDDINF